MILGFWSEKYSFNNIFSIIYNLRSFFLFIKIFHGIVDILIKNYWVFVDTYKLIHLLTLPFVSFPVTLPLAELLLKSFLIPLLLSLGPPHIFTSTVLCITEAKQRISMY